MRGRALPVALAAAIVAIAAIAIAIGVAGGCDGPACDLSAAEMSCGALGERDLNPANRPVPPRLGRPLLARGAGGRLPIGFNDSAFEAEQVSLDENVALHRAAGSTLWRFPLDWSKAQPEPGPPDWTTWDAIYCASLAAGIRPVFHISAAPEWAADTSEDCFSGACLHPPDPGHYADLREFAERAAIRYPRVAAFEAWNEPNLNQFWDRPDPRRYAEVQAVIYRGVKDGNPRVPVLGGALSNIDRSNPDSGNIGLGEFLSAMYRAGAGRSMDAISLHPYPVHPLDNPAEAFTPALAEVRRIAAANDGPARRRIWVTETGASLEAVPGSAPFSPAAQARTMSGIHATLARAPDVDAAIFHTLVEPNEDVASPPGFGWVVSSDGGLVPRPVYCRFAARVAKALDCSAPLLPE